jgi:hypothetical protein
MSDLSEIRTRSQLARVTARALDRLAGCERDTPGLPLWASLRAQLEFVQHHLRESRGPEQRDRERIILGVQAVRELDDADPAFAGDLKEIDYAFRRWERLAP